MQCESFKPMPNAWFFKRELIRPIVKCIYRLFLLCRNGVTWHLLGASFHSEYWGRSPLHHHDGHRGRVGRDSLAHKALPLDISTLWVFLHSCCPYQGWVQMHILGFKYNSANKKYNAFLDFNSNTICYSNTNTLPFFIQIWFKYIAIFEIWFKYDSNTIQIHELCFHYSSSGCLT